MHTNTFIELHVYIHTHIGRIKHTDKTHMHIHKYIHSQAYNHKDTDINTQKGIAIDTMAHAHTNTSMHKSHT